MDIESSIQEYANALNSKCPKLKPSIFPRAFEPESLFDCFQSKENQKMIQNWLNEVNLEGKQTIFDTSISYSTQEIRITGIQFLPENDKKLTSIPQMMKLMTLGEELESSLLSDRFLELNGYSSNHHIVNESFNIAYALRVLISNVPGMRVTLGEETLPVTHPLPRETLLTMLNSLLPTSSSPPPTSTNKKQNKQQDNKQQPSNSNDRQSSDNNNNKNNKTQEKKNKKEKEDEVVDEVRKVSQEEKGEEKEEVDEDDVLENEGKKKKRRKRGKAI